MDQQRHYAAIDEMDGVPDRARILAAVAGRELHPHIDATRLERRAVRGRLVLVP